MKTENVFIGLKEHVPPENYFTECFAFLLRNNKQLLKRIINDMLKKKGKKSKTILHLKSDDFGVKTQVSYGRKGIVDIVISCDDKARIFIENKLRAQLRKKQLRNYRKLFESEKQECDEVFVFLITQRMQESDKSESLLRFRWLEVNDLLKNYVEERGYPFLKEFIEFMGEYEYMNSFSRFKPQEYGCSWEEYIAFTENVNPILNELKRMVGKKGLKPKDDSELEYIGFWFYTKDGKRKFKRFWYWVGFALSNGSVHFGVELDFQKKFREDLRDKSRYYNETREIQEKLSKHEFEMEWDHDYIAKDIKLINLMKGTRSRNEQKNKIINFLKETIKLIENSGLIALLQKAEREF